LMLIGGCGFSTAGGIKIYRFFLLKNCKKMLKKETRDTLSPANKKEIIATLIIITLFPVIATIAAIHLTEITDASFENAFFEAVGLITTGGLSSNVVTVDLDPATKIAFSFLMIFGRLEIIAIVYIFAPKLAH